MFSPVEKEIRKRIVLNGKITFAEFMAVLLYHPQRATIRLGLIMIIGEIILLVLLLIRHLVH